MDKFPFSEFLGLPTVFSGISQGFLSFFFNFFKICTIKT